MFKGFMGWDKGKIMVPQTSDFAFLHVSLHCMHCHQTVQPSKCWHGAPNFIYFVTICERTDALKCLRPLALVDLSNVCQICTVFALPQYSQYTTSQTCTHNTFSVAVFQFCEGNVCRLLKQCFLLSRCPSWCSSLLLKHSCTCVKMCEV